MSALRPDDGVRDVPIEAMSIDDYDAVYALLHSTPGIRLRAADSRAAMERYLARNPGMSFVARYRAG